MIEQPDTIVVFTGENPEEIILKAGSDSWTLDPDRASKCSFLVCVQNREAGKRSDPTKAHGEAFLVGKIRRVRLQKRQRRTGRFMIHLASYARVSKPDAWSRTGRSRNPVRYTTLRKMGILPSKLNFLPIIEDIGSSSKCGQQQSGGTHMGRMEGITGWFSEEAPEFDAVPVFVTRNDDGSVDLVFEYPGDGEWRVHLTRDEKWDALSGFGACHRSRATVLWAHLLNIASRRWLIVGEWVQEGTVSKWWTEVTDVEARASVEASA